MSKQTDKWAEPQVIGQALYAFPANVVRDLMPTRDEIPSEFEFMRGSSSWLQWQQEWFFGGLKQNPIPKPGIDLLTAMRHLAAIQRSFEPKHEHKVEAVAYLASRWFLSKGDGDGETPGSP